MQSFILPLSNLFQFVLETFYMLTQNYGLAIILLSSLVSVVLLPLQLWADKLQQKDLSEKDAMRWALDSIKSLGNAQKKFYYTKEIYRRYGYNPIKSLRSLVGLLIQLPFFLAAYFMLKNFDGFKWQSFWIIKNLAASDGLLWGLHLLPLIMTLINFISAGFYLLPKKNLDRSAMVPQLILPLLFFLLLYNKNSALLLYWTCNNIFSLAKNYLSCHRFLIQNNMPKNYLSKSIIRLVRLALDIAARTEILAVLLGLVAYLLLVHNLYNPEESARTISRSIKLSVLLLDGILFLYCYRNRSKLQEILSLGIKQKRWLQVVCLFVSLILLANLAIFHLEKISGLVFFALNKSWAVLAYSQLLILLLLYAALQVKQSVNFPTIPSYLDKKKNNREQSIIVLVLLPFVPVFNMIQHNLEYLSLGSIFILVLYVVFALLPIIGISMVLLQQNRSPKLWLALSVGTSVVYYAMPSLISLFRRNSDDSLYIQILFYLVIVGGLVWALLYYRKFILVLSVSLFVCFLTVLFYKISTQQTLQQFVPVVADHPDERFQDFYYVPTDPEKLAKYRKKYQSIVERVQYRSNVYLLVYDGYANQNMMSYYGIDNNRQYKYLESQGFRIYPNAYTAAPAQGTGASINSLLEFDAKNSNIHLTKNSFSGNSTTDFIFKSLGYITGRFFTSALMGLGKPEVNLSLSPYTVILKNRERIAGLQQEIILGIRYGEFRFNRVQEIKTSEIQKAKQLIFQTDLGQPQFFYSHLEVPGHAQFSGACRPDETKRYKTRLKEANQLMKEDITNILAHQPNSIIIVASDHGPYLTKDCKYLLSYTENEITAQDIADRYGILLAIRLPDTSGRDESMFNEINFLQQVIPASVLYLTGGGGG